MDYSSLDNKTYWRYRALLLKQRQLEATEDYEHQLFKRLDALERAFEKDLKGWYQRYADNNGIPVDVASKMLDSIKDKDFEDTLEQFRAKALKGGYEKELDDQYFKSRIARLQSLQTQLKETLSGLAVQESTDMSDALSSQFQDTYMRSIYNIQQQGGYIDSSFARFNDEAVKVVIAQGWEGKSFSERIWRNYRETLPSQLTDSLLRSTIKGDAYTKVVADFRERYRDVKKAHIHRLVVTEMGHVAEKATARAYDEEGIQRYRYLATLERRTCDRCGHLDGKVFKMSERRDAVNYPLLHPYCRCTTTPEISTIPKTDSRYDQENAIRIKDMSFEEWQQATSLQSKLF